MSVRRAARPAAAAPRSTVLGLQGRAFQATPEELELQRKVVGHDRRAFETFVWELAPEWRKAAVTR